MRAQRRLVYVFSVDVDGAFDAAPNKKLVETVKDLGAARYICRYLSKWLTNRVFSARLSTRNGRNFCSRQRLRRGLPQGGVSPPFLWILHFNPFAQRLVDSRNARIGPAQEVIFRALRYADDVVRMMARRHEATSCLASWELAGESVRELDALGLSSKA